jgi:alpha-D-ribose 1-methylphosphonate 5-triphosphate synthase subunit PhnG
LDAARQIEARRGVLAVLSRADAGELRDAVTSFAGLGEAVDLKPLEIGLVMLRGRIGGDGAPFNVGEATVARAVIRLADGTVGYGMRLGRDGTAARDSAVLDALWQSLLTRARVEREVLAPLRARIEQDQRRASEQAAASRVEFFTLARESA